MESDNCLHHQNKEKFCHSKKVPLGPFGNSPSFHLQFLATMVFCFCGFAIRRVFYTLDQTVGSLLSLTSLICHAFILMPVYQGPWAEGDTSHFIFNGNNSIAVMRILVSWLLRGDGSKLDHKDGGFHGRQRCKSWAVLIWETFWKLNWQKFWWLDISSMETYPIGKNNFS